MKRLKLLCAVVGWVACTTVGMAQEKGNWRAASKTAASTTGDVAFTNEKISINFASFPIAQIRALQQVEIGAMFDSDSTAGGSGNLYRLSIPAVKKFLHKNSLCGDEETQWMTTYVHGRTLELAFFSGATMPVFTPDAIANATNLCGIYSYSR
jgi:hypothetical protein